MHSYAGFPQANNSSQYKKAASIKESKEVADFRVAVTDILVALKVIITLRPNMLYFSGKTGGEAAYALMIVSISAQQKKVWMYSAYLGKCTSKALGSIVTRIIFIKKTRK